IANYAYVVLVFAVLGLTLIAGWKRWLAMIPTLYLSAFVWDNRLVMEPSITRLILIGVILIVLMNLRPQGLLGTQRVDIVGWSRCPSGARSRRASAACSASTSSTYT